MPVSSSTRMSIPFRKVADGLQMLLGKDFRRSHHTCLIAVVQGDEHGHESHERLARTYITLQEAVHLSAAAHIGSNFVHHPFLCSRQFERQMMGIEPVEDVGDAVEDIAPDTCGAGRWHTLIY